MVNQGNEGAVSQGNERTVCNEGTVRNEGPVSQGNEGKQPMNGSTNDEYTPPEATNDSDSV